VLEDYYRNKKLEIWQPDIIVVDCVLNKKLISRWKQNQKDFFKM
jgi:hypothetical protein